MRGNILLKNNFIKKFIVIIFIIIFISGTFLGYMFYEYQNIKITSLNIDKLNGTGIKIIFAADFQYDMSKKSNSTKDEVFQKSIDLINSQNADIILLGGDYQTYGINVEQASEFISQLKAPMGVYGIFGNHDGRVKDKLIDMLDGKVLFLENDAIELPIKTQDNKKIVISGVGDLFTGEQKMENFFDSLSHDNVNILLTHSPDYFEIMTNEQRQMFDIVLAGHVHAGQITFFGKFGVPIVLSSATMFGEKYRYGDKYYYDGRIYITSGLGGSVLKMPVRFGAQPEIVVIT